MHKVSRFPVLSIIRTPFFCKPAWTIAKTPRRSQPWDGVQTHQHCIPYALGQRLTDSSTCTSRMLKKYRENCTEVWGTVECQVWSHCHGRFSIANRLIFAGYNHYVRYLCGDPTAGGPGPRAPAQSPTSPASCAFTSRPTNIALPMQ